jgi:hypothetical protein
MSGEEFLSTAGCAQDSLSEALSEDAMDSCLGAIIPSDVRFLEAEDANAKGGEILRKVPHGKV